MAKISKSIIGDSLGIQGGSVLDFKFYGSRSGLFPTISSTAEPKLIVGESKDFSDSQTFDDTVGTTNISGSSFIGVEKRQLAPNHKIVPESPGSPINYDGSVAFKDRDDSSVSVSSPNLTVDLKSQYHAGLLARQFRNSGNAVVLTSLPQQDIVYSGSKGSSTSMLGTFFGAAESHFTGETLITDIFDTNAAACRGFIDGTTSNLGMTNLTTGSFFTEDISNTPFTDQTDKEVLFKKFTDTEIKNTLPSSVSGSVFSNELLPGERFATGGFTYEPTSFGPDTHGTDSVAYGGLLK
ncbi:MAG: hypothetical protein CMA72_09485 [Euryarchaeota archaeon]|nr:hypothetical protein [Euryarchaeota archaeon]|tara:strand:- start:59 stop:943 length:885 start_codon:yes stop_codon:yes gene_type:complete